MTNTQMIAIQTVIIKEYKRITRIWTQTFLPPVITVTLYFMIFGNLIGSRVGEIAGHSYMQYLAPGLIMMTIITNSFSNVATSFFNARFQRSVEEMLISPISNKLILLGYVLGGMMRGLLVGLLVTLVALFFTHLHMHSFIITIAIAILTSLLFSLAGFTNAIYAKNFDDIMIIPTFVLTPLTYLGGVFYSLDMLPPVWRGISHLNPILYMVNTFRYGILGVSDINIFFAFGFLIVLSIALFAGNLYMLEKGIGIRS